MQNKGHFLERTLQNQGLDPTNLSPVNQQILRGRQSGIQQRDIGASTRTVRAQTRKPHAQLQQEPRGRGRPRTNEYTRPIGPVRPVGRPQTNEYSRPIGHHGEDHQQHKQKKHHKQQEEPVTRKMGGKK